MEEGLLGDMIGIMQGRLTPPQGRGIQFFPFENWENEFRNAPQIGLNHIDFIFDYEQYEQNPLWTERGIQKIISIISGTGVKVNFICADFFMREPFFRNSEEVCLQNIEILKQLITAAGQIKTRTIEIPLLDNSSMKTDQEKEILITSIKTCLPSAEQSGIELNFETDLPPQKLLAFITGFNHPLIKITYDSGNSASLGFDPHEEIKTYGQYITNIHIKDRLLGGATVPLGTGNTNFSKLFQALQEVDYKESYTLQAARGEEGKEVESIKDQITFLKGYIDVNA